jgi:hypothetical protein
MDFNDFNGLNLLMNTKKVKTGNIKSQLEDTSEEDNDNYNSYNKHDNILYNNNETDDSDIIELEMHENDNSFQQIEEEEKTEKDKELNEIMQCLNKVDNYILDNQYNNKTEIINDYLIDLLYLIKTKKE